MARNCSETIVSLDDQEQPIEVTHRRTIVEAVKKFSSLAKSSASRVDFRKPFLPGPKSFKPVLQPWPSATNISRSVPLIQTPIPTSIEARSFLRRDSFKSLHHQSSLEESDGRPSVSSQGEAYQDGVVNSAFAEEMLHDVSDICDCDGAEEGHEALESGLSHEYHQCRQACQELPTLETLVINEPGQSRINNSSKYLMVKSDRSPSNSRKRKGIQWRPRVSSEVLKFRRRTTDSIPTVNTTLTLTRSSPNLSNLQLEEQMKTLSDKTDPSCKQKDDSKLWITVQYRSDWYF